MYEIEDIINSSEEDSSDVPDEEADDLSWAVEDGAAIKKTDRPVFLYRETVIPPTIREFFAADGLGPGQKRRIVLWHGGNRFEAFIEKTVHASPRTRMRWKLDFAAVLRKEYPQWLEFFNKIRAESADTPSIQFTRRQEPDHYTVELEGAPSQDAAATDFEVPVQPGDTIDNDTLKAIFRCSPQGAIRRSHGTNSLVLISDHTKSAYEDKWIGKIFHYTGMGVTGEQSLSFQQNKTLAESRESGVRLWLFEVFEEGRYVYIGEVELTDHPYRSRQPDSEKNIRDVYIFPLKLKGHNRPPLLKKTLLETKEETVRKKAHKLPLDELEFVAKYALKEGGRREVVSEVFEHDQIVSEYAKRRAAGTCQLCGAPAPFSDRHGDPFLEIHHLVPLAEGGTDTVENVAALCPNCHRRMHVLDLPADVAVLRKKLAGP
jgi:5-methylcytosine-specific restriction protein A